MANKIETSSALLIRTANADARKNVSKWRWGILGICLSLLPVFNVIAFIVAIVFVYLLIPKIDLSIPDRLEVYSQHPALYTEQYRKTVKKLRFMCVFCGWIVGIIFLNPF